MTATRSAGPARAGALVRPSPHRSTKITPTTPTTNPLTRPRSPVRAEEHFVNTAKDGASRMPHHDQSTIRWKLNGKCLKTIFTRLPTSGSFRSCFKGGPTLLQYGHWKSLNS